MIRILLLVIITFYFQNAFSQEPTGKWYFKTHSNGSEKHYILDLPKQKESSAYLDLPSDKIFRLELDSIIFQDQEIYLAHKGMNLAITGIYTHNTDQIHAVLKRDTFQDSIILSRNPAAERIQTIKKPIPYRSEEISFYNSDHTKLTGTITYPIENNSQKAVILISGSGPQNRDSEILGHKPFKILADHLTRKGITVLRYDDRGYAKSEGKFRPATTEDYADDVIGAINFLKKYDKVSIGSIGLIGHSEGGNIAPMVAANRKDIEFIVLLAAPGTSNYESYLVSLDLLLKDYPETYDRDFELYKSVYKDMSEISKKEILKDSLTSKFRRYANVLDEEEVSMYGGIDSFVNGQIEAHTSEWYHYYLQFDVTKYLEQLKIPILALNGDRDISVEADFNLNGIERTLNRSGNKSFKTIKLRDVNHFFQSSEDDKIENVYFNKETFSKEALGLIAEWIQTL
ncbi:alpha/beta hydrolase family protein [Robertkochia aurantiaca]|uniref:alpha/beta hydrolase family protein n=1 Tax=Robertkochia aurantiaca TaxID=2873700 RepID=UPI001CCCECAA|nr:alpha/beta fold hydrolase [Robertkochia sp. 3YJGBD-33]